MNPHCETCGAECIPQGCTTGYGTDKEGRKHCFKCCATLDRAEMQQTGRFTGYLTFDGDAWSVSNWPGSLRYVCTGARKSAHNIGRIRIDAWFVGPDGHVWHAVNIGDSQIARCRRTRKIAEAA